MIWRTASCRSAAGARNSERGVQNSKNEATVFQEHVDLAMKTDELILIHTPHLEDKYKGTRMIIDMLKGDKRVDPGGGVIDHLGEDTGRLGRGGGVWGG